MAAPDAAEDSMKDALTPALPFYGQNEPVTPPDFRVRKTDPDTSFVAAKKVGFKIGQVRLRVIAILDLKGPMTDEQLIKTYHSIYGDAPESTIRTRRSELSKEQPTPRVIRAGETDGSRKQTIWALRRT
jgi:hypothetical protein